MIRYQLALLGHSQRWLPPSLAFGIVLGILYSDRGAPVIPEFAVSAGALTVVACWFTIALVDAEDPTQRLITLVHARRRTRVLTGIVLAVFTCCALLTVLSLVVGTIRHQGAPQPGPLGLGVLAHLAAACTGVAIGLPCSRLLLQRRGITVLVALALLVLVVLVRWIPLVNPMVRAMSAPGSPTPTVLADTLVSLAVLALSATGVGTVLRRRS